VSDSRSIGRLYALIAVIATGGHKVLGSDVNDTLVAYALTECNDDHARDDLWLTGRTQNETT
jgi:hypothetical protein|tara:strand:- start:1707 stop:1892 length:186 start_codon:yes stop_codon:yes gene_type:complete